MEINIINYILDKKNISQNQLAEMLDPPVTKSVISKWKNGNEAVPEIRKKQLTRIARFGGGSDAKAHNQKWVEITGNSEKVAYEWYERIYCFLDSRDCDLFTSDPLFGGEINKDSVWIDNIQKLLITINDAGVPIKDLLSEFSLEYYRETIYHDVEGEEYPVGESIYTPTDNLLIPYIKKYLLLRHWLSWHILQINDKNIGQLQYELALQVAEVALYQLPKENFEAVGTNLVTLEKFIEKSKKETFRLIGEFSNIVATGFDYFRYINADVQGLENDIKAQPKWIEGQKKKAEKQYGVSFDSAAEREVLDRIKNTEKLLAAMRNRKEKKQFGESLDKSSERQILDGIKNNEKLLKEILEKLNNLTNNGENK